jgi:hypothetical protein
LYQGEEVDVAKIAVDTNDVGKSGRDLRITSVSYQMELKGRERCAGVNFVDWIGRGEG